MYRDGAIIDTQKLFLFFGSDVKGKGPAFLQDTCRKGYTLLALDTPAVGLAAMSKVPFTLIDDWLDSASIAQARKDAAECEQKWYEAARDEFTSDGICWPEVDHRAMHWFWADTLLADVLLRALRTRGCRVLGFFRHSTRRPKLYYCLSDIYSALWETELGDGTGAFEDPQKHFWYRVFRYAWSNVRKIVKVTKRSKKEIGAVRPPSVFSAEVVLAFNPGEFHRFTGIMEQLSDSFPGKVAAVILSPNQATAIETAEKWRIPVICGPCPAGSDLGLQERFLRGYVKALDAARDQLWKKPLECLGFHFEHFCRQRWPELAASFRLWRDLWGQVRPGAVLVSALEDSESQLPAEAAKVLGIPTLSIPHGGGMTSRTSAVNIAKRDYVLYSFLTQRAVLERSGVPGHRLIACRDLVAESEYPVVSLDTVAGQASWRLLALTDPVGWRGCLAPIISIVAQMKALQALNDPPADIAAHLSLKIKIHPNRTWSDLEFYAAMEEGIEEHVLPLNSELSSVLEETSLVVAVNYGGSALVHTLRSGKPVIFFYTDRLLMERAEAYVAADLYLRSGTLVQTAEELWVQVRGFFTDSELAEKMRLKAQAFCRNNFDDSNYPTIGEVVGQVLSKR